MPNLFSYRQSDAYRKQQSEIIKNNWLNGVYSHRVSKLMGRKCRNPRCTNTFKVKPYDPKVFCSKHCSGQVNNVGRKISRETKLKIANALSSVPVTVLKSQLPKKPQKVYPPFVIKEKELRRLYWDEVMGAINIAQKYNVSTWQVFKKLRKYNIPRRTTSETNNLRFMRKPPSYNFKKHLALEEKILYNSAVMLYWGEGAKSSGACVDLANGDERMVLLFLKALREVFVIDESKLRGHLYCYANQDVKKLELYWSRLLNIPLNKFMKSYVRQDFNPKKDGKLPHGVMHIIYYDKKLFMQIMEEIGIISR